MGIKSAEGIFLFPEFSSLLDELESGRVLVCRVSISLSVDSRYVKTSFTAFVALQYSLYSMIQMIQLIHHMPSSFFFK